MTKVIAAVVSGLLLSGCALPAPFQIASWALDGFSLLTTKKSLTDHGISFVAQKDCALWRGISEGAVCQEDDPMAIIAERGDVGENGAPVDVKSSLTTSAQLHAEQVTVTQSAAVKQTSWTIEPETKPETVAPAKVVAQVKEQPAQWQLVSREEGAVVPDENGLTSYSALPGNYFVIGSFGVWDNARKFATKNPALDAQIMAANVADYRVFRIVVGPYNSSNQASLHQNIKEAGVEDFWAVRIPADEVTLAWRASDFSTELASLTSAE